MNSPIPKMTESERQSVYDIAYTLSSAGVGDDKIVDILKELKHEPGQRFSVREMVALLDPEAEWCHDYFSLLKSKKRIANGYLVNKKRIRDIVTVCVGYIPISAFTMLFLTNYYPGYAFKKPAPEMPAKYNRLFNKAKEEIFIEYDSSLNCVQKLIEWIIEIRGNGWAMDVQSERRKVAKLITGLLYQLSDKNN